MAPPKLQSRMSMDLPRLPFQMDMLRPSLLMLLHQVIEKKINQGKKYLVGLQPLGFKVFVDGVILNSVGVWERFKDKIYPRIRVPDFILPLKLALFSPFLGVSVFLMG